MKKLLDCRVRPTWRAVLVVLGTAWIAVAAPVASASAQEGGGVRAGFSANPHQFFIGGHYVTRPLWDRLRFQPTVEAGFGDDRTVVAFNAELRASCVLSDPIGERLDADAVNLASRRRR
jgi:hypothetical protein